MMIEIAKLRQKLEQQKGKQQHLISQGEKTRHKIRKLDKERKCSEEAQAILQTVAQLTQQQLEYHVSTITSLAMNAVFQNPYKVDLSFVLRRGKTEADIRFVRNEEAVHPLTAAGGGAADIAAFALRITLWSLSPRKSRPVFFLDEPFKHLSDDLQPKALEMIKQISDKLGIQIIMISQYQDVGEFADNVIEIKK